MKLKLASIHLLDEVDRYIRQYDVRDHSALIQAASDCFDGSYTDKELMDLVTHGVLRIVWYSRSEREFGYDDESLCGHLWTVDLTDKALRHFWPERWNNGAGSVRKRPVPRARVRTRPKQVRNLRRAWTRCSSHN